MLDVAISGLRSGSCLPDWLPERRRPAEAALTSVVATCCLLGVSARRMEKLVGTASAANQAAAPELVAIHVRYVASGHAR
jgi:transposase-like protein